LKENICKLEFDNAEHMPIGFEIAFPSLLEIAQSLNIEIVDDSSVLQDICKEKLKANEVDSFKA
jgi:ent-copalyl diphosphate synthase